MSETSAKPRTLTDFVEHVENTLGWVPPVTDKRPLWRCRQVEVVKLGRKIKERPKLYAMDNLLLAVEYCRRNKIELKSPVGVCFLVERALKETHVDEVSDLDAAVDLAISEAWTASRDDWVRRLSRAVGPARADVVREWQHVRYGNQE